MMYLDLCINKQYLRNAYKTLKIPFFPDINKSYENIRKKISDDEKLLKILFWLKQLQKEYIELATSLVYAEAFHQKNIEENMYFKDASDPFNEPRVSYFIDNASNHAFSLIEKLAQLINVFNEIGLKESNVSFEKVYDKLDSTNNIKLSLLSLYGSFKSFKELRHRHTHRSDPENTKWEITGIKSVVLKSKKKRGQTIFYELDEKQLPVTPKKQIDKCLQVLLDFQSAMIKILYEMENDFDS